MSEFWVFAYGSLMWNPGFPYQDIQLCRLFGYHRNLCIYSTHYRGTPQQPGLVLGLDRGGSCAGMAFHVNSEHADHTYRYLVEREQVTGVYCEKQVWLHLENGRRVKGLAFVADPTHPQYAGQLDNRTAFEIVAASRGQAGLNKDYVLNTVHHLHSFGVRDRRLEQIMTAFKKDSA